WREAREQGVQLGPVAGVHRRPVRVQAVFRMHMTKATLARRGIIRHTFVRADGPTMDAGDRAELDALLARLAPELSIFPLKPVEAAA
ncbi:MAG: hypothetical protein AAFW98_10105, partial [Pseudomonadota bacterium]